MISLALFEPEIPQNAGTLIRLSACFNIVLHIIMPCGFLLDSKRLKRAGMSYMQNAKICFHNSYEDFLNNVQGARIIGVEARLGVPFIDFAFKRGDILLLGKESIGFPQNIFNSLDTFVNIPMVSGVRSLNLAVSASIVISEAMRQLSIYKLLV